MNARDLLLMGPMLLLLSCTPGGVDDREHALDEEEGWPVTAWGKQFEIFAEMDPLVVGESSMSHTHVTILEDFSPMQEGTVTAILRDDRGGDLAFPQPEILRSGIYNVKITPVRAGEFQLLFRVETPAGAEEIASARVSIADGSSGLQGTPESDAGGGRRVGRRTPLVSERAAMENRVRHGVDLGGLHPQIDTYVGENSTCCRRRGAADGSGAGSRAGRSLAISGNGSQAGYQPFPHYSLGGYRSEHGRSGGCGRSAGLRAQ